MKKAYKAYQINYDYNANLNAPKKSEQGAQGAQNPSDKKAGIPRTS